MKDRNWIEEARIDLQLAYLNLQTASDLRRDGDREAESAALRDIRREVQRAMEHLNQATGRDKREGLD